ncbi:alanine--glyoxylate aminotransferase-like [Amphiura filiformis]|uniref:alanine--glyoxylate aminotransferase-like n=1 Tax=Amphiura filiformis TaxID=82378 RepID=UPI003B217B4A
MQAFSKLKIAAGLRPRLQNLCTTSKMAQTPAAGDAEGPKEQYSVAKELHLPMNVPRKLLLGPGPSNAPPRILAASALPLLGHLHPEFLKVMHDITSGLQYAFQTTNKLTLAISGTGHAGMEAAMMNIAERGETILVANKGLWGVRMADLADRMGINAPTITKPMGEAFTLEDIKKGLEEHKPSVFLITHGESSSGVCQPLEGIADLCHSHNCLFLVDTVAALGGVPLYVDKWGIDVVYSGSQKVIGAPPGTAPISFSPRAQEKMSQRKTRVPSFYFDMAELGNYWGCDAGPARYHHTGPISSMYALREGLGMLADEGLESYWKRHKECAEMLHAGLEKMGLTLYVKDKGLRLPTVTTVEVPDGIDWKEAAVFVMGKYKIEIAGGLGASAGKVWRIGLMGHNAYPDNVRLVLRALEDAINHCRDKAQL